MSDEHDWQYLVVKLERSDEVFELLAEIDRLKNDLLAAQRELEWQRHCAAEMISLQARLQHAKKLLKRAGIDPVQYSL